MHRHDYVPPHAFCWRVAAFFAPFSAIFAPRFFGVRCRVHHSGSRWWGGWATSFLATSRKTPFGFRQNLHRLQVAIKKPLVGGGWMGCFISWFFVFNIDKAGGVLYKGEKRSKQKHEMGCSTLHARPQMATYASHFLDFSFTWVDTRPLWHSCTERTACC